MEDFKKAIVENAYKLIDAVNSSDFDGMAKTMQFLVFATETLGRCHAFENYLYEKAKENEPKEE